MAAGAAAAAAVVLYLLLQTLPGTDGETATQGLDNLGTKCKEVRTALVAAVE